jgi:mRNA interferase MazF
MDMGQSAIAQFDLFWVVLDPTIGSEIAKTRPCVIISPNEMNAYLRTVIIAPLTSTVKSEYPFRVTCSVAEKTGSIAIDQLRTVDKRRLGNRIGRLTPTEAKQVKHVLQELFG